MVVELTDPVTGSQQMSLDEWPFSGEFTIRALTTSSTNNYFLRTRIIKISLVEHIKPNHITARNEGAVVWFLRIFSPKFSSLSFPVLSLSSHPHLYALWGSQQ